MFKVHFFQASKSQKIPDFLPVWSAYLLKIPHLSIRSDFDAEFQRSTACVFLHHPLMGIEKAVKAMAASAGTTVPEKNFDGPVPDKNPGGPAPEKNSGGPVRVTVTNLNGETLLEQVRSVGNRGNGGQLGSFQFFLQKTLNFEAYLDVPGRNLVIQMLGSVVFFPQGIPHL